MKTEFNQSDDMNSQFSSTYKEGCSASGLSNDLSETDRSPPSHVKSEVDLPLIEKADNHRQVPSCEEKNREHLLDSQSNCDKLSAKVSGISIEK